MQTEDIGMLNAGRGDRKGNWMETVTGKKFFPLDPRPEEVDDHDIAWHLARINRYNGAIRFSSYSVAYHSVKIAEWLLETYGDPLLAYQGLFHDAPEAYIGDMVRPLKREPKLAAFSKAEVVVWRAVVDAHPYLQRMGYELDPRVVDADNRILVDERRQVMFPSGNEWGIDKMEPLGVALVDVLPHSAYVRFLGMRDHLRDLIEQQDEAAR